ncbi:MAG: rod shape-determining protein MreD [Woeseia sp.]|nr:rod shape-determining protein MreD [Woeseia sp.]MBT8096299.1 rod shape-determining protein MreD [Woeseia sp.]NNE60117.1 rod shape-determining protein MreD [Woeseia sp.]NNL54544.1 rod shape-determining protein MreD [Woeseia sp.]
MANDSAIRRLPVYITIVVALMLAIAPLSDAVRPFWPDWVLLSLIYWSLVLPRYFGVGLAWLVGLVVDVAQGTLLGQHALTMSAVIFLVVRFQLQLRVFPLSQLTLTVVALLGTHHFLLFWINGVAGINAPGVNYWGPVLTGTLAWPLVYWVINLINIRRSRTG